MAKKVSCVMAIPSMLEREDRKQGVKQGGLCVWLADGDPVARITAITMDPDGDPWFDLEFINIDHKPVRAERSEIAPLPFPTSETLEEGRP